MTDSAGFSWGLAVQQLVSASASQPALRQRFNPRPPGVIHAGSATDAVLAFLQARPGRFYTSGELMRATDKTHAAISWSLIYLRKQGRVDCIPDIHRNERYKKYTSTKEAPDDHTEPISEACGVQFSTNTNACGTESLGARIDFPNPIGTTTV